MIEMRLAEVAAVTGGRLHRATGDEVVRGVEFDSRRVRQGSLFLALAGARHDGHDFAAAAVAAGASAVLAGREPAAGEGTDVPAVIAPPAAESYAGTDLGDTDPDGSRAAVLEALARLARHSVDALTERHGLQVVGVTGSSGKTSTKDLIAAVLAPLGPTVAPPGSFNNELGHPYTALAAAPSTRHLVLELSSRGPGHVARLCRIAPPRIGVVLNVGSAHVGEFGSREAIAAAKGELVEALPPAAAGGVAILNADDVKVAAMAARTEARVLRFGRAQGTAAEVTAREIRLVAGRAQFRLVTPGGSAEVALRLVGEHHVDNALAAAAVAHELGSSAEDIAAALSAATPASRWRMEVSERPDGVTVVNDAYNANPESMRAALRALAAITSPEGTGTERRSWAVLGPMGELGERAAAAHAEVAAAVRETGADRFVAVGAPLYGQAAEQLRDVDEALALLRAELRPGDVVLVKASRAAGLDRVAAALLEAGSADDRDGEHSAEPEKQASRARQAGSVRQ